MHVHAKSYLILLIRVLVQHDDYEDKKQVVWHIPSDYKREMSLESETVCTCAYSYSMVVIISYTHDNSSNIINTGDWPFVTSSVYTTHRRFLHRC